jgi:hypothetical protein
MKTRVDLIIGTTFNDETFVRIKMVIDSLRHFITLIYYTEMCFGLLQK